MVAAGSNRVTTVEVLLQLGAEINAVNDKVPMGTCVDVHLNSGDSRHLCRPP